MYIGAVLGYLSWPFLIAVSYVAVRWALRYYEKKFADEIAEEEGK